MPQNNQADLSLDLTSSEVLSVLKERITLIVLEDRIHEAYWFVKNTQKILDDSNSPIQKKPEMVAEYEKMIAWARFVRLPMLVDEEFFTLLREHFLEHYALRQYGYDFLEKLQNKILGEPLKERDGYKRAIKSVMLQSGERVTSDFLTLNNEGDKTGKEEKVQPTFSSWFRDFRTHLGLQNITSFEFNDYIARSQNTKALSNEDKLRLRELFQIQKYLDTSSEDVEGIEDRIVVSNGQGKYFSLSLGEIYEVKPISLSKMSEVAKSPSSASQEGNNRLRLAYSAHIKKQKELVLLEKDIFEQTEGNTRRLRKLLSEALEKKDINTSLASLFLFAKGGMLHFLFRGDRRFVDILDPYISQNFSEQIITDFRSSPHSPAFINALLRVILQGKLGLDENVSAIYALQMGEIAFVSGYYQYYGMTYGDASKGSFVWHDLETSKQEHLVVSSSQIALLMKKLEEIDVAIKWQRMKPGVLVTEDRRGRPSRLHEVGKGVLNTLTEDDLDLFDINISKDFLGRIKEDDVLAQIEEHARRVRNGDYADVDSSQAARIFDFSRLLRV